MPATRVVGVAGGNQNKTSGTTLTYTVPAITTLSGDVLVVAVAFDNLAATGPTITVADNAGLGHTYTPRADMSRNNTTAAAGIRTAVFTCPLAGNMSGKIITATLSGAVTAKAIAVDCFRGLTGALVGSVGTSGVTGGTTASAVSGDPDTGDLIIGVAGAEMTGITGDTDTLDGAWTNTSIATSGGSGNTNMAVMLSYKIVVQGQVQTYNPTWTSTDAVVACFAMRATAPPPFIGWGVPIG